MTKYPYTAAETALYLTLLQLAPRYPVAEQWLAGLPHWLAAIKDKKRYAHVAAYQAVLEQLPMVETTQIELTQACVGAEFDWSEADYKKTVGLLKKLMPWRKGGFLLGRGERQIHLDTEWRSDFKWNRLVPHISDLSGKRVLDVGGGSGYHGWRMAGLMADMVMVIDPSCLFYHQFLAIRHFLQTPAGVPNVHYLPVGLEALPQADGQGEHGALFHTVFSMGVLYHRASPFEHLEQLKAQLTHGGELVLETLVVEGDATCVLVPQERYAQMNNVYFIPSIAALQNWLAKVGFINIRCVDVTPTTVSEQRATEWMTYQSLADFLHPTDRSKTIEGYPAPLRAVLIANKP